jgi:hypothetical protein
MPERIVAAQEAVVDRLNELKGNSDHHGERLEMQSALAALTNLKAETRIWPDDSFIQKEIQERFEKLFHRPMPAKERASFWLSPEKFNLSRRDNPQAHPDRESLQKILPRVLHVFTRGSQLRTAPCNAVHPSFSLPFGSTRFSSKHFALAQT